MYLRRTVSQNCSNKTIIRRAYSRSLGGYPRFIEEGFNDDYLPVWLQQAGYNTYYTGKLMNGSYNVEPRDRSVTDQR